MATNLATATGRGLGLPTAQTRVVTGIVGRFGGHGIMTVGQAGRRRPARKQGRIRVQASVTAIGVLAQNGDPSHLRSCWTTEDLPSFA